MRQRFTKSLGGMLLCSREIPSKYPALRARESGYPDLFMNPGDASFRQLAGMMIDREICRGADKSIPQMSNVKTTPRMTL